MKMPPCECGQPGVGWNDDGECRCEDCLFEDYAEEDRAFDAYEDEDPDFV